MAIPAQYMFYAKPPTSNLLDVGKNTPSSGSDNWCDYNPFVEEKTQIPPIPQEGNSLKREISEENLPLAALPAHLFEDASPAFIENDDPAPMQHLSTFSFKKVGYIAFFALMAAGFWFVHSTDFFAQKETPSASYFSSFWR